jgi:methenyltetrahydrofolate cyclohydrolase
VTGPAGSSADPARALEGEPLAAVLDELARSGRVPGAGSVAAIVVGMAAAIVARAARGSTVDWQDGRGAVAQAEALRRRAAPLADLDARALAQAVDLLEPAARASEGRDFELGLALSNAADVPLSIVQVAADVAELAKVVAEEGDSELRPDAVGAAFLAAGAARAAAHLVEINLGTTDDDFRVLAARSLAAAAASWAEQAQALDR